MEKIKKSLFKSSCLGLVLLLLLSFAGCANNTAANDTTANNSIESTVDTASAAGQDASDEEAASSLKLVLDKGKWAPDTYAAAYKLIENNANTENAYAVFDWDNTCIFQDTTDNIMNYQINNLKFKMNPEEFEYGITHGNNDAVPTDNLVEPYQNANGDPVNIEMLAKDLVSDYTYFWEHYQGLNPEADGALADIEAVRATDEFKDFQAKFWFTYIGLIDTFGENIAYTWQANCLSGHTVEELSELCGEAIPYYLSEKIEDVYYDSPESLPGATGQVKNSEIGNYFRKGLRIIPEMVNLMNALRDNGIEVYISTAAVDMVVRNFACNPLYGYNVPEENVIGIRMNLDENGVIQPEIPDTNEHSINVKQGKVDNIVRYLVPKYDKNPILIGGDSSGDYEMMTQFTGANDTEMVNDKDPLQLVLISNCVKSGGMCELSKIAASQMGTENPQFVLQGRNEYTGLWIPDEQTLKLGADELQLTK